MPTGKRVGSLKRTAVFVMPKVFVAAFATSTVMVKSCTGTYVELRGNRGEIDFDVTLADTPEKCALRLMQVEHLPKHLGILLFYSNESELAFWMKDTHIVLDMRSLIRRER